jgi:hypothetical protein
VLHEGVIEILTTEESVTARLTLKRIAIRE